MDKNTKHKAEKQQEPIILNRGMTVDLMHKFGVCHRTVKTAITGDSPKPLHQAIRKEARKMVEEFLKKYE